MQIDDIVARFRRADWNCCQVAQGFYKVNPPGLYGYKEYLLTFNPWQQTWHLVPTRQPNDPQYEEALKILSDRHLKKSDRHQLDLANFLIIQDKLMFPVKVSPTKWINLASINEVKIKSNDSITVTWSWGESENFTGDAATVILKGFEDAQRISFAMQGE